jgi:hypothetical protein
MVCTKDGMLGALSLIISGVKLALMHLYPLVRTTVLLKHLKTLTYALFMTTITCGTLDISQLESCQ